MRRSPSVGSDGQAPASPHGAMKPKGTSCRVRVLVRVRPFLPIELEQSRGTPELCIAVHSETLISALDVTPTFLGNFRRAEDFPFDSVLWSIPPHQVPSPIPYADQSEVFKQVGVPALDFAFEGYNGCIFAYGQTGSGKTYTVLGSASEAGLIPRLCVDLFARIQEREQDTRSLSCSSGAQRKVTHNVSISYMEIYNEKVRDLLVDRGKRALGPQDSLEVHFDPRVGPIVKGLRKHPVEDWDDVLRLLEIGGQQRATIAHRMNDTSSRSHAVVQIMLDQSENIGVVGTKAVTKIRRSRINFVDLAGSEKVEKTKVEGAGFKEAVYINTSLSALGRVIDMLIQEERAGFGHIPYRDSVLTMILSDSLGGNSRTTMLATVSPARYNSEETLSTLRYAVRARKIVNVVHVNEDPCKALIRELQEQLAQLRQGVVANDFSEDVQTLRNQLSETERIIQSLREREKEEAEELTRREQKWAEETALVQQRHQQDLEEMERKNQELQRKEQALREEKARLQQDFQTQRRMSRMEIESATLKLQNVQEKHSQALLTQEQLQKELAEARKLVQSYNEQKELVARLMKQNDEKDATIEDLQKELALAKAQSRKYQEAYHSEKAAFSTFRKECKAKEKEKDNQIAELESQLRLQSSSRQRLEEDQAANWRRLQEALQKIEGQQTAILQYHVENEENGPSSVGSAGSLGGNGPHNRSMRRLSVLHDDFTQLQGRLTKAEVDRDEALGREKRAIEDLAETRGRLKQMEQILTNLQDYRLQEMAKARALKEEEDREQRLAVETQMDRTIKTFEEREARLRHDFTIKFRNVEDELMRIINGLEDSGLDLWGDPLSVCSTVQYPKELD